MRMISGAILIFASAVSAAGYEIALAVNVFRGGPLSFLAWVFGLAGIALMAIGWYDDSRRDNVTDKVPQGKIEKRKEQKIEKPKPEKNEKLKQEKKK